MYPKYDHITLLLIIYYNYILQLLVEQNVHSVHCASFHLRTSKKLNKYYFKLPGCGMFLSLFHPYITRHRHQTYY